MQQAPNGVVRHLNISRKTTMRIGNPQLVTYWKSNGLYWDFKLILEHNILTLGCKTFTSNNI